MNFGFPVEFQGCTTSLERLGPKHQPQEAMALFREAFQVTPALQEVLQWVAKAESHWAMKPSANELPF